MMYHIPSCLFAVTAVLVFRGTGFVSSARVGRTANVVLFPLRSVLNTRRVREAGSLPEESPCLTIPYLTELKNRFVRSLDHNDDGLATFDEVKDYMRRFKVNVKDEDVHAFIRRKDLNENGAIDLVPEYVRDMTVPDYTMGAALEWFNLHDTNDDTFVSDSELTHATQVLGMSPEEALETVQGYYMAADLNDDGKLSFTEFKTLYNQ